MRRTLWLTALLMTFAPGACWAQDHINVGTVTKYTGRPDTKKELADSELYMATLETQVAAELIKFDDVDYMDRSSVDQVFQEMHLSSDAAFNPASGALRGLLGRLDFLIVIDTSSPSVARIRALDNETGAVRGVAQCQRMGSAASSGSAACVKEFAKELHPHLLKLLNAKMAARDAVAHAAIEEQDREAQVGSMQSALRTTQSRLAASNTYWNGIHQQLSRSGLPFRQDIQASQAVANQNGARCQSLFDTAQPGTLKSCLVELNQNIDQLDSYK